MIIKVGNLGNDWYNLYMKVLSLFDGMSCGQLALKKLGIKVDKYYASEIDKYAIQVTQANFPETIQVGDVCNLKAEDYQDVDLILAGSPCQGFSFAGKQLAFDDPRSALFFEFIRLLKEIKPKYFLLENVKMKKEFLEVITEQVSACYPDFKGGDDLFGGRIEPILINSALVSAQSRQRYYWTNIPNVEQPEDLGIVLRDILEDDGQADLVGNGGREAFKENIQKGTALLARDWKGWNTYGMTGVQTSTSDNGITNIKKGTSDKSWFFEQQTYSKDSEKTRSLKSSSGSGNIPKVFETKPKQVGLAVEKVKVRKHEVDIPGLQKCILEHYAKTNKSKKEIAKELNDKYSTVEHYFRKLGSDFFAIPSEEHWPQLKKILGITTNEFDKSIMEFEIKDGVYETTQRIYSEEGKSPTLTSAHAEKLVATKPKQVGIASDINGHDILKRVYSPDGKSPTLNAHGGGNTEPKVVSGGALRARSKDKDGKNIGWKETKPKQMLELRKDEKANAVSTVSKDSLVVNSYREVRTEEGKKARRDAKLKTGKDHTPFRSKELIPRTDGKVGTITPNLNKDHEISIEQEELTWRKLTPLECERLQTVPDNYTNHVSKTQRYKMLGNGWTVSVISHILSNMESQ